MAFKIRTGLHPFSLASQSLGHLLQPLVFSLCNSICHLKSKTSELLSSVHGGARVRGLSSEGVLSPTPSLVLAVAGQQSCSPGSGFSFR